MASPKPNINLVIPKSPLQNANMVSQIHAVLLLSLSIHVFSHSFLPANAEEHDLVDVEGICRETINYKGCMQALHSDPRTKKTSNFMDLAKIALELGVKNSTESKAYIDHFHKENPTTPAIEKCSSWYQAVVASFRGALSELDDDALSANYDVKVASDYADGCEKDLASSGVKVPSISTRNQYVLLYSSIGYVITNKL